MTQDQKKEHITPSGRVNYDEFKKVLTSMEEISFTGSVSIKAREGYGTIYLNEGTVISVTAPEMHNRLKFHLIAKKHFSEDELAEAEKTIKKNQSASLLGIVRESGMLPDETFNSLICDIAREVIFSLVNQEGVFLVEYSEEGSVSTDFEMSVTELIESLDGPIDEMLKVLDSDELISSASTNEQDLMDHRSQINDTLSHVAKSISTFRPHEVVILVEDESFMRQVLSDGLQRFGFDVESFDNAKDALGHISTKDTERFSLIIVLDLMMSGLYDEAGVHGGIDLLDFISRYRPSIPVVITTAVDDPEVRLKTLFLGASSFVLKPNSSSADPNGPRNTMSLYLEELAFCIENIFRKQQAYLEKEQLLAVRDELLQQLIKRSRVPILDDEEIYDARVLMVDDEESILKIGYEILKDEGFKDVDTASNGSEAISLFNEKKHDVVITDLVMPKKNGIELLKYVKIKSPHSQVIIITGNSDKNSAIAAVKLGAYDYIEKPINFEILPKTISRAVELKFILDNKM